MRDVLRFGSLLVLSLALAGCPAAKLYREGMDLDEAGKEYQAAQKYLEALDANEKHGKAGAALVAVSEEAYKEKLSLAERYEQEGAYPKALDEYRALDKLLRRLQKREAVSFPTVDTAGKIDAMANAAADGRYRAGEERLGARAWEEAIAAYKGAQSFKHGYKDTAEKIAQAYYGWGEDDLAAKRYRAAAERWSAAIESAGKGYRDAARRGGAVYAALGRHFVTADRCRQAVRDLRLARELDESVVADADLAAAEECAVTPVAILPFENPTGTNIAGMAIGDSLAEQVGGKVQDGASEFVRLLERAALDSILAEQNLSTAGLATGGASRLRGVRYLVLGKLTQVRLDQPAHTASVASATGQERYSCTKKRSDGSTYEGTCFRDFPIRYVDHRARVEVRLAGSVKVVDVKTGEQVATLPFEAAFADEVHYATDFKSAGGSPVTPVGRGRTGGVEVESDFLELVEALQDLADEGQLLQKALAKIAAEAGEEVLGAVDVEREASDPLMVSL